MKIYSNHPCRLTLAELDTDLPCKEDIFCSPHPFMQDDSIFTTRLTISQAFALLFDKLKPSPANSAALDPKLCNPAEPPAVSPPNLACNCELNVFDLFVLIHCKYSHASVPPITAQSVLFGIRLCCTTNNYLFCPRPLRVHPLLYHGHISQPSHDINAP